jgi:hypothetical protein
MRPQLEREQIELRIDLVPDLPPVSGDSAQHNKWCFSYAISGGHVEPQQPSRIQLTGLAATADVH